MFCFLDVDLAQKGPTSPSEGPDFSLFSSYCDIFLAFNVTNSVILLVSLVGCLNDLFV
jgi:hypothetical protein